MLSCISSAETRTIATTRRIKLTTSVVHFIWFYFAKVERSIFALRLDLMCLNC